jgi:16S rRNA U1498 N3-methylase RsmE
VIPLWSDLTATVKLIVGAVALVVIALLAWGLVHMLTARPKAEARLNKNTTEAALQSGRDAVGAVSEQQAAEQAADATTRANAAEIAAAPGSNAKVNPAATAAGIKALCKRASARNDPKCAKP